MAHFLREIFIRTKCSKTITLFNACRCYSIDTTNILRSVVPDITVPKIFLDEYIWQKLDKWENKIAVQSADTGRKYLYSELYKKSGALSNFLLTKIPSIKGNDTLAIILPNVPEYPIIMFGIIKAGFKATTVNSYYKSDEIYKQLLYSETKFIFTTSQLWPDVKQALHRLNADIPVVIIKQTQAESLPEGTMCFNEIVETQFETKSKSNRNIEDIIVLPFSSGTTGLPKGVALTHKNIVANLCQMKTPPFKLVSDSEGAFQEILPTILPFYHIYGMIVVLMNALESGGRLITIPKFTPEAFINILKHHNPTVAYLASPTATFLINNKDIPLDQICRMNSIIFGAAPLGAGSIHNLYDKYRGRVSFLQNYGLTETSPVTHSQIVLIENGSIPGGAGLNLPNTECLIVGTDSEDKSGLNPNTPGHLLIRGPQVMKGYFKNEEATKNAIDADGWFKTGDIAYYDQNGHLFVTDRIKDLIKVKGFQVAPAELEDILRTYPDVEDAAVIGCPDPLSGEVPKAFVVPKQNTTIDSSKIEKYVASKVAPFKHLRGGVSIVDSIPKSPSGKILRRLLK